jgi:nitroimidazol reductase NimA-like FMN-containing flavoprotein (pyridoxamine 5'-phosphate oxidase superfamily)
MPTTDDDRAQEVLGRAESLRLLATAGIGRLAYSQAALPAIRPVSFSLQGDDLLITVPGRGPLIDALRGSVVAFEADAYDEALRTGWTVAVVGASRVLDVQHTDESLPLRTVIAVRVGLVEGLRTGLPT